MKNIYREISKKLDGIDFGALWPGFRRYDFALYDSKDVVLGGRTIPWDERFMGNTAVEFEGGPIAIWNMEPERKAGETVDIDCLAANMVHEMFHAFQFENKEHRFPNDLEMLTYPYDVINAGLKFAENNMLAEAFDASEAAEKIRLLGRFAAVREKRGALLGGMIENEYLTETGEGMAEYVGCRALGALSESKYLERTRGYAEKLRRCDAGQLDIRRISYYSGALFLLTAYDAGIPFHHDIASEKRTVYRLVAERLDKAEPSVAPQPDNRIAEMAEAAKAGRKAEIDAFLQSGPTKTGGAFYISGYDPMNMIRSGDRILCSHFIRLTDEKTEQTTMLHGHTLLEMAEGSVNRVAAYYR